MSVTYIDFRGPYRSIAQAETSLKKAEAFLDKVNGLSESLKPYNLYRNVCSAQEELNEVHEAICSQFGEEVYKKIVQK